jgi:hypothetical protein
MKKDEIAVYSFDPEKKEYVTRSLCEKLLKEIKSNLARNRPITVVLTETTTNV